MGDTGYWVAYTSATMQEIPPLVLQQPSSRQPIMSALALTPARTLPNLSVCGPYTATPGCVSVGVWHCSKQGTTPSKSLSQPTRVKQVPSDKTRCVVTHGRVADQIVFASALFTAPLVVHVSGSIFF